MLMQTIAVVAALAIATTVRAAIVTETADAGDSLATASIVSIADPTQIIGTIETETDADLYGLTLGPGVPFSAITSSSDAFGIFDTQLFLFDATGRGVDYNDDITTTDFFSRIDFLPSASGLYYLGISAVGFRPTNAAGDFLYPRNPFDATGQLGASPAGLLAGWSLDGGGITDFGTYAIALTGVAVSPGTPIPTPGSLMLVALGLGILAIARRRRVERRS